MPDCARGRTVVSPGDGIGRRMRSGPTRNPGAEASRWCPARRQAWWPAVPAWPARWATSTTTGLPDVAVAMSDRVLLFKNHGGGKFTDVTAATGVQPANHPAGITFVDYDHDGDLDLFVTGQPSAAGAKPNVLWRNNGNGTFTNWTEQAGLGRRRHHGGRDPV